MFVSKKQHEALLERVRDLESQVQALTVESKVRVYADEESLMHRLGVASPDYVDLTPNVAIKQLASLLGVKFEYHPGAVAHVQMKKADKK